MSVTTSLNRASLPSAGAFAPPRAAETSCAFEVCLITNETFFGPGLRGHAPRTPDLCPLRAQSRHGRRVTQAPRRLDLPRRGSVSLGLGDHLIHDLAGPAADR